jgi:hypothetical protein
MSIVTFYAVLLNLSAFINPFFIFPWIDSMGYTYTFLIQGLLTIGVSGPVFAWLHWKGAWLRNKSGMPNWVNPEYAHPIEGQ